MDLATESSRPATLLPTIEAEAFDRDRSLPSVGSDLLSEVLPTRPTTCPDIPGTSAVAAAGRRPIEKESARKVVVVSDRGMPEGLWLSGLWGCGLTRRCVPARAVDDRVVAPDVALLVVVLSAAEDLGWAAHLRRAAARAGKPCVALTGDAQLIAKLHDERFGVVIPLPYRPALWDTRLEQLVRAPERRSLKLPVRLRVWTPGTGRDPRPPILGSSVDLSRNGLLIGAAAPLALGTRVDVELRLPPLDDQVVLFGRVVRGERRDGGSHRMAIELVGGRGDGYERFVEWLDPLRRDGAVSAQRSLEEELRASETRLRAILDSAIGGLLCFEPDGRVVEMNATLREMIAWPSDLEVPDCVFSLFAPELAEETARRLADLDGDRARGTEAFETWVRGRGGRKVSVEASLSPSFVKGRPVLVLWLRDLTRQKAHETEHRRLAAKAADGQRLASLGLLAGTAAHDFNNILVDVMGHSSLVSRHLGADHPAAASVEAIRKAAHRGKNVVGSLLGFSGRGPRVEAEIRLHALVREAVHMVEGVAGTTVRLDSRVDPRIGKLVGDPTPVAQILLNLLHNAVEALPDAGGRVSVEVEEDGREGSRAIRLRVVDDGCGMTAETRERLFEPFFTTKEEGHGLGLAGVAEIVEGYGGEIGVVSSPGCGTTIEIRLPVEGSRLGKRDDVEKTRRARGAGIRHRTRIAAAAVP